MTFDDHLPPFRLYIVSVIFHGYCKRQLVSGAFQKRGAECYGYIGTDEEMEADSGSGK